MAASISPARQDRLAVLDIDRPQTIIAGDREETSTRRQHMDGVRC